MVSWICSPIKRGISGDAAMPATHVGRTSVRQKCGFKAPSITAALASNQNPIHARHPTGKQERAQCMNVSARFVGWNKRSGSTRLNCLEDFGGGRVGRNGCFNAEHAAYRMK